MSVVVTCFNQGADIIDLIGRILPQLYAGDEILVSDDGSTDGSPELITSAFGDSPFLSVLRSPATASVSRTRNRGLAASRTGWVCFMDGDDTYTEGWRDAIASGLSIQPALDVLFTDFSRGFVGSGELVRSTLQHRGILADLDTLAVAQVGRWRIMDGTALARFVLNRRYAMHTINSVYRREWLVRRALTYDPRFVVAEDTDFQMRAIVGARVGFLPEITACYRPSASGLAARDDLAALTARMVQVTSMRMPPEVGWDPEVTRGLWRRTSEAEANLSRSLAAAGLRSDAIRMACRGVIARPTLNGFMTTARLVMKALGALVTKCGKGT